MNENEVEIPFEALPKLEEKPVPKPKQPRITKETVKIIAPIATVVAILYSICFTGVKVYPKISFTIFVNGLMVILWFGLKKLGYLKNRKAAIWFLPIFIISLFNGVFSLNFFDYGNVIVVHLLFAVFTLNATVERIQGNDLFVMWNMSFLNKVIRTVVGNWTLFVEAVVLCFQRGTEKKKNDKAFKIFIGMVIGFPVVVILCALLLSADMVFEFLFDSFLDFVERNWQVDDSIFSHVPAVCIAFMYASGYVYNANRLHQKVEVKPHAALKVDVTIGATFLILINGLFCVFTIVQFAFLFSGGFMKLPGDVVYSEYAREGFFQLLFVTVINFSVLLFFTLVVQGAKESKLLKALLIMLCGFTGVLIVSSFYRMNLYIQIYGFTSLRLQVITFLVMEVFLVGVTIGYFLWKEIPMGKYFVLIGLVFYIIVNVTGSEYFSTKMNVQRFWKHPNAKIDLVGIDQDSISLVIDVYSSRQFIDGEIESNGKWIYHTSNRKAVDYQYEESRVVRRDIGSIEHWQNWSLLSEISRQKDQQYERFVATQKLSD